VPEQQLDLFRFAARGPAQLRGCATAVVRRDPRHSNGCRLRAEHLPDHLFGQDLALHRNRSGNWRCCGRCPMRAAQARTPGGTPGGANRRLHYGVEHLALL